jgi:hypothetical protein
MHRVRLAVQSGSFRKLGGEGSEIEADETFIGGKARNMHVDVKQRRITGTGTHRSALERRGFGSPLGSL